jgi:DNA-binding XRE family transcriptional regulator
MNKPIRTIAPNGDPIVILSAENYERLIEAATDARDATLADRALANYRAGKAEALTAKEMRELLAATTPLAFWRKRRGFTQAALAEKVGVSQAYLGQIETGKREGVATLYAKIAKALGIQMEDLVDAGDHR